MNTNQTVSGTYHGVEFTGVIAASRPTPDYRNMIYTVSLDSPLVLFGTSRERIEIATNDAGASLA